MKKLYILLLLLVILAYLCHTRNQSEPIKVDITPMQEHTEDTEPLSLSEQYAESDKELIAKVLYAESRGECDEGQQAIVQVILNRVYSTVYPDTIDEVIRQHGQFVIGNRYTEKEMRNVDYVLEFGFDLPLDVMYFGTWQFRQGGVVKIGNHYFMR